MRGKGLHKAIPLFLYDAPRMSPNRDSFVDAQR
jgi:hypothetical protein